MNMSSNNNHNNKKNSKVNENSDKSRVRIVLMRLFQMIPRLEMLNKKAFRTRLFHLSCCHQSDVLCRDLVKCVKCNKKYIYVYLCHVMKI